MDLDLFVEIYCVHDRHKFCERAFVVVLVVCPLKSRLPFVLAHVVVLDYLAHLSIQKCVSDDHFFILELLRKVLTLKRQIVKIEGQWPHSAVAKSLLELLELLDEGAADLQIGTARVQELEGFQHAPPVLAHEVGS